MVREEIQREKLRASAGKRVWAFEERLRGGGSSLLAQLCWEEMQKEKNSTNMELEATREENPVNIRELREERETSVVRHMAECSVNERLDTEKTTQEESMEMDTEMDIGGVMDNGHPKTHNNNNNGRRMAKNGSRLDK
ncbi:hypothetical protein ALC57_07795 [Trachymyrmex cornetzi]|uniref:Uncharacterized protein n=1 Tax=Trachymyrmex cornetzi TaxID=471704 RepID=A0A151J7T3_9HYME|nr:hypothetical protein ALC57_07795 [Trachymyrmex cornetzi]